MKASAERHCKKCGKTIWLAEGDPREWCMDCICARHNRPVGVQQGEPTERETAPASVRQYVGVELEGVRVYDYDPRYRGRRRARAEGKVQHGRA